MVRTAEAMAVEEAVVAAGETEAVRPFPGCQVQDRCISIQEIAGPGRSPGYGLCLACNDISTRATGSGIGTTHFRHGNPPTAACGENDSDTDSSNHGPGIFPARHPETVPALRPTIKRELCQ